MIVINIGGGSISGTIPESFEKFQNLELMGIAEHCLTGKIPELISSLDYLLL